MTNKIRWDLCQKAQQNMWQKEISMYIYKVVWFGFCTWTNQTCNQQKAEFKRIKMLYSPGMTAGGQCKI